MISFFTSNDSIDEINRMLNEVNKRHPNIKITSTITNPTSFLDVNDGTMWMEKN